MKRYQVMALGVLALPVAVGLVAGCDKADEGIKQYEVAHVDNTPGGGDAAAPAGASAAPADAPPIAWTAPAGWKQLPGDRMRYASFAVSADHPELEVSVSREGGTLLANVNRWESQLGLPASSQDQVGKELTHIDDAGTPIDIVNLTGPAPADHSEPKRFLAAIVGNGDQKWYFKLAGPADEVESQASVFADFIRSVKVNDASGGSPPAAAANAGPGPAATGGAADPQIKYAPPAGWATEPAKPNDPFRIVAFSVPGKPDGGEMAITHVPQNTGTMLDNINLWRSKVSLDPLSDATLAPAQALKNGDLEALAWTFDNPAAGKCMRVAMITHGGQWWVFKLIGSSALVTEQKFAFDSSIMTVQFSGDGQ